MISFFRKIRRGLLTDNKFSRYLVYAAGEIVLVFIGILIALQVNNRNETRKKEKTAIEILKQIQTDLVTSVANADGVLKFYYKIDSLAYLVLSEKVTAQEYLSNPELVLLINTNYSFFIKDYGFKKLDQYLEYMPKETELLKRNLYYLYTDVKHLVEIDNDLMANEVDRNNRMLKENKNWFWKFAFSGSLDNEALDYFLTDPMYKNYVEVYCLLENYNLCFNTMKFRTNAIKIYNEISETIKSDNSADTEIFPFYLDVDNYKNWTGKYKGNFNGEDYAIEITIEDGTLFWQLNNEIKREIFPFSGTRFYRDGGNAYYSFIINENKDITGLQLIHWSRYLICNKIE